MDLNYKDKMNTLKLWCKTASASQLEDKMYDLQDDLEQYNIEAVATSKRTKPTTTEIGIVFRTLIQSNRFDYIKENYIKGVLENTGSIMEHMIARDILEIDEHMVTNAKGIDVDNGRWSYEIKALSSNSACSGYPSIAQWHTVFEKKSKLLLISIDSRVYKVGNKKVHLMIDHLEKNDCFKFQEGEYRIKAKLASYKIIARYGVFEDTVALY